MYADLTCLTPPFSLHWPNERLSAFADSLCPAVRQIFEGEDRQAGKDCIDSTIATWGIALDRMTYRGEGVLIANNATLSSSGVHRARNLIGFVRGNGPLGYT